MEGLPGFHCPQFSEETAWVPGWLQQLHVDRLQTPSDGRFEGVFVSQQKVIAENGQKFFSGDEGRYNCHLFLSGEDNSPLNFSASSGGVAQFHLQLSSVGRSQDMLNSFSEELQAERDPNYDCIMQKNEVSSEDEANEQFEVYQNACRVNFPIMPRNKDTAQNDSLCDKEKDSKMELEEIISDANFLDIRDAVELSIAATEALSVHEILSSCSCLNGLSAEAVIEISLRVKQARLNLSENVCDSLNKDDEEVNFLSDLDDFSMEGAFADVGICTDGSHDFYVSDSEASYVKDTPSLDKHHGVAYISINPSYQTAEYHGQDMPEKELLGDDHELDFQVTKDCENLIKAVENSVSVLKLSNISCHNDTPLHSTPLPTSDDQFGSQEVKSASEDMSPMKPHLKENLSTLDDDQATAVPERFQSRWLGGWTSQKEMVASRILRPDNANYVPRFLVQETSYLTESADIAPDESSVVRAQDKGFSMASQYRAENFTISPQDVMMCSSPSLVDPLCSTVPCSIPENESDDVRCDSRTDPMFHYIDLQTLNFNVVSRQQHNFNGFTSFDNDDSNTTIRRQLTSLKDYSMVLPYSDSLAEKQIGQCNKLFPQNNDSSLLSAENTMAPAVVIPAPTSDIFERPEEYHVATQLMQNPIIYPKIQSEDCIETKRVGSKHLLSGKKRASSPNENHHMLQASKLASRSSCQEVETMNIDARVQPNENLQEQSGHEISPHAVLSTKRRVQFSESVIKMQQLEKLNKREVSRQDCSNNKVGQRVRNAKYDSKFRAKEGKRQRCLGDNKKDSQRLILQDLEFMLTGFTRQKEKELEDLIRKHGGIVLHDIPCLDHSRNRSVWLKKLHFLVILCPKKLETTKFLFGCAVDACILKANWLTDSIVKGLALAPEKYFLLPNRVVKSCTRFRKEICSHVFCYIFQNMGFMLHVKGKFSTKLGKIIKYGGGKVFKTLRWLVKYVASEKISFGAIIAEDENRVSRHLKQCASKSNISVVSVSWVIDNLYSGPILPPLAENNHFTPPTLLKTWNAPAPMDLSQEI